MSGAVRTHTRDTATASMDATVGTLMAREDPESSRNPGSPPSWKLWLQQGKRWLRAGRQLLVGAVCLVGASLRQITWNRTPTQTLWPWRPRTYLYCLQFLAYDLILAAAHLLQSRLPSGGPPRALRILHCMMITAPDDPERGDGGLPINQPRGGGEGGDRPPHLPADPPPQGQPVGPHVPPQAPHAPHHQVYQPAAPQPPVHMAVPPVAANQQAEFTYGSEHDIRALLEQIESVKQQGDSIKVSGTRGVIWNRYQNRIGIHAGYYREGAEYVVLSDPQQGGNGVVIPCENVMPKFPLIRKQITLAKFRCQEVVYLMATSESNNVPNFYGLSVHGGDTVTICIWMEFISNILDRPHISNFDVQQTSMLLSQALEGLGFIHQMSVLHLDIKPANLGIDITRDSVVWKFLDFGAAIGSMDQLGPNQCEFNGMTPEYLAPEVYHGIKSDKADVWAIACCVIFMMCRKHVWHRHIPTYPSDQLEQRFKTSLQVITQCTTQDVMSYLPEAVKGTSLGLVLECMLQTDHQRRCSAFQAHCFLNTLGYGADAPPNIARLRQHQVWQVYQQQMLGAAQPVQPRPGPSQPQPGPLQPQPRPLHLPQPGPSQPQPGPSNLRQPVPSQHQPGPSHLRQPVPSHPQPGPSQPQPGPSHSQPEVLVVPDHAAQVPQSLQQTDPEYILQGLITGRLSPLSPTVVHQLLSCREQDLNTQTLSAPVAGPSQPSEARLQDPRMLAGRGVAENPQYQLSRQYQRQMRQRMGQEPSRQQQPAPQQTSTQQIGQVPMTQPNTGQQQMDWQQTEQQEIDQLLDDTIGKPSPQTANIIGPNHHIAGTMALNNQAANLAPPSQHSVITGHQNQQISGILPQSTDHSAAIETEGGVRAIVQDNRIVFQVPMEPLLQKLQQLQPDPQQLQQVLQQYFQHGPIQGQHRTLRADDQPVVENPAANLLNPQPLQVTPQASSQHPTQSMAVQAPPPLNQPLTGRFSDAQGASQHVAPSAVSAQQMGALSPVSSQQGAAPIQQGAAPIQQGAAPIQQGAAPVQQGAAPVQQGAAPIQQGAAPIQQGAAPVQQGAAPHLIPNFDMLGIPDDEGTGR